MESNNSTFFDTDNPELKKAVSNIIKSIAQSSQEGKKELLITLSERVKEMDLKGLDLAINDQGLQKEVNKELFIKFVEEALEGLASDSVDPKIIENALKSVNQQAISNVINNNKGSLGNLVSYFKSASANEKIGIASAVMVLGAAFSPLIVLATLIALVAIGARYAGIGIGKAGEKIKEEAIETGKAVKSSYKDLIDKLPTIQAREDNFSRLKTNVRVSIANVSSQEAQTEEKELIDREKIIGMLQDKNKLAAIEELIKDGTIQNFSAEDMRKLAEKGNSTHAEDMEKLVNFMDKFQPAIMAISSDINKVEQKVNEKVQPKSQVDDLSSEQATDKKVTRL